MPSHARVRDQLPHVLVGMNEHSQIDAIHRGIPILNLHFPPQVFRFHGRMSRFDGIERALQPVNHLRF
jgi:hypothetical protein